MSWLAFWAIVFWVSVGSFALVSTLVAFGGLREVRALFRELAELSRGRRQGPP
jgi:hypothetical protein